MPLFLLRQRLAPGEQAVSAVQECGVDRQEAQASLRSGAALWRGVRVIA
jgi:hypothetical protein